MPGGGRPRGPGAGEGRGRGARERDCAAVDGAVRCHMAQDGAVWHIMVLYGTVRWCAE